MGRADLLIVIGTSLTVHPFASLAGMVQTSCPRVLINIERVGNFGHKASDVVLLGKCDELVRDLCAELGWGEELEKAWAETAERMDGIGTAPVKEKEDKALEKKHVSEEEKKLEKEVDSLTAAIEARLDLQAKMKELETQNNAPERNLEEANDSAPVIPSESSHRAADSADTQSEIDKETSIPASNTGSGVEVKPGASEKVGDGVDGKL